MSNDFFPREPSRFDALINYVKTYIIKNSLQPGDPLPTETALARELGVSRGSVREAVKAMAALGIIEVRHGDGLYVRGFNLDAFLDMLSHVLLFDRSRVPEFLQVRRWLELAALDVIVARADQRTIDHLNAVIAQWEEHANQEDNAWRLDHREFHRVLNSVVRNDSLVALVDGFWILYNNLRLQGQVPITDVSPIEHCQNHRRLLNAIAARDLELAKERYLDSLGPIEKQMSEWDPAFVSRELLSSHT